MEKRTMTTSKMDSRTVAGSALTLTTFMQPEHSNSLGTVHGGVVLKLCDECGGIIASRHARRPAVTVTVDSVTFHHPILVGQLLLVHGRITYVGTTSMEVELRVEAENLLTGDVTHTNSAYFVYVALDDALRPTPVPRLLLQNDEEEQRFQEGKTRQAARLRRQAAR
jgi:acyl-CoA hydrolase